MYQGKFVQSPNITSLCSPNVLASGDFWELILHMLYKFSPLSFNSQSVNMMQVLFYVYVNISFIAVHRTILLREYGWK